MHALHKLVICSQVKCISGTSEARHNIPSMSRFCKSSASPVPSTVLACKDVHEGVSKGVHEGVSKGVHEGVSKDVHEGVSKDNVGPFSHTCGVKRLAQVRLLLFRADTKNVACCTFK